MIGIAGLTAAFLLIASIVCYIFIAPNANPIIKAILIIITIWYAVALYSMPQNLCGWPMKAKELPDGALILSCKIIEPSGIKEKGGMNFWLIENIDKIPQRLDPREAFIEINKQIPRAYQIPYNRELHKQLEKSKRKSKESGGLLIWKKGMKLNTASGRKQEIPRGKFQIINPHELLPRKDNTN